MSRLNKKAVKAVVLGPESSATETRDASEGKYKPVLCFGLRPQLTKRLEEATRVYESVHFQVSFQYRSQIDSNQLLGLSKTN